MSNTVSRAAASFLIPLAEASGACITNYTAMDTRRVDATVSVAYGADLEKTRTVLRAVVEAHPLCLGEPAPTVEVMALDASAVRFVVRPWVKTADYWQVMFALQQRMKEALDQAGIAIPFPQLDVHLQQGAQG